MTRSSLSAIVGLLLICGPSNVSGLVAATIVNPVQCVAASRVGADIGKECREIASPQRVHGNSAASIVVVAGVVLVEASRFRANPCGEFPSTPVVGRSSVRAVGSCNFGGALTSTAFRPALSKSGPKYRPGVSALASALPVTLALGPTARVGQSDNGESPIGASCQINGDRHDLIIHPCRRGSR